MAESKNCHPFSCAINKKIQKKIDDRVSYRQENSKMLNSKGESKCQNLQKF